MGFPLRSFWWAGAMLVRRVTLAGGTLPLKDSWAKIEKKSGA